MIKSSEQLDKFDSSKEKPNMIDSTHQNLKITSNSDTELNKLNTGKWSDEERCLFLKGVLIYKKDWGKLSDYIKTRNPPQIRSHAQKLIKQFCIKNNLNDIRFYDKSSLCKQLENIDIDEEAKLRLIYLYNYMPGYEKKYDVISNNRLNKNNRPYINHKKSFFDNKHLYVSNDSFILNEAILGIDKEIPKEDLIFNQNNLKINDISKNTNNLTVISENADYLKDQNQDNIQTNYHSTQHMKQYESSYLSLSPQFSRSNIVTNNINSTASHTNKKALFLSKKIDRGEFSFDCKCHDKNSCFKNNEGLSIHSNSKCQLFTEGYCSQDLLIVKINDFFVPSMKIKSQTIHLINNCINNNKNNNINYKMSGNIVNDNISSINNNNNITNSSNFYANSNNNLCKDSDLNINNINFPRKSSYSNSFSTSKNIINNKISSNNINNNENHFDYEEIRKILRVQHASIYSEYIMLRRKINLVLNKHYS